MTIQPIGPESVALYLTPADLREHGLTPEELTRDLALVLTRRAFQQSGLPAEGPMEIEAYPDPCGVLVFARLREPAPRWFSFEGLEPLLAAAGSLPVDGPDAALAFYDGCYWLSIPAGDVQAACRLSEFGAPAADPFLDAKIAERGAVLIPGAALSVLLHWFPD